MNVGVAGLVQSGGFGSFSKRYGTAASSLLAGAGRHRRRKTAHRQCLRRDADLFWGLKGGGGGIAGRGHQRHAQDPRPARLSWFCWHDDQGCRATKISVALLARFVDFYADSLVQSALGRSASPLSPDNRAGDLHGLGRAQQPQKRGKCGSPSCPGFRHQGRAFSMNAPLIGSNAAYSYWDVAAMRRSGSRAIMLGRSPRRQSGPCLVDRR